MKASGELYRPITGTLRHRRPQPQPPTSRTRLPQPATDQPACGLPSSGSGFGVPSHCSLLGVRPNPAARTRSCAPATSTTGSFHPAPAAPTADHDDQLHQHAKDAPRPIGDGESSRNDCVKPLCFAKYRGAIRLISRLTTSSRCRRRRSWPTKNLIAGSTAAATMRSAKTDAQTMNALPSIRPFKPGDSGQRYYPPLANWRKALRRQMAAVAVWTPVHSLITRDLSL